MEPGLRFERALEVPDGIVKAEHRLTAAAVKLLTAWELGHTLEAVCTVEESVRDLRDRYIGGQLDRLLLNLDDHTMARLPIDVGAAVAMSLKDRIRGIDPRQDSDLIKRTVEAVLSQLRKYVNANPIDVD